ncbi:TonB-dependent receptor [Labilibacter sediminis]|nr:TonB-dependent receptor [Labilibacter sediminis]
MKIKLFKMKAALLLMLIIGSGFASAQKLNVTGVITDAEGYPIPGASIVEKGTTNGTVTDFDGNYSINVEDAESVILFSFIGMTSQEVVVGSQTEISLVLQEETVGVEEVVVVGYSKQKKANLTGAVGSMTVDESVNQPVTNTAQMLQGRMSGVQLTQASGQPGYDNPTINIRGVGTNGNSAPMVIIDGVERPLGDVSPSDIESISVLKDAASAAIYGARAANGVLLITTKSGKSGEMKVNYNGFVGWQQATVLPDMVGAADYARMINEATGQERYSQEEIALIESGEDKDRYADTDWADELFRTAPMTNHYLSFSGGDEKSNYFLSMNYMGQQGTMQNTSSDRYNLRGKYDVQVKDWLKVGVNMDGSVRKTDQPAMSLSGNNGLMNLIYTDSPVAPVKYSNGDWGSEDGSGMYPVKNAVFRSQLGSNNEDQHRFNTRVYANMKLASNLSFETSVSYRYNNYLLSKYNPSFQQVDADGDVVIQNDLARLQNKNTLRTTLLNENLLRYNKDLGKSSVNVLLGHSTQQYRGDTFMAIKEGYINNENEELGGGATMAKIDGGAEALNMQSFFSRAAYNYDDKYLFEANVRVDGSSRFPEDNKYGVFPSFSGAWRVTQEPFAQDWTNTFSNIKLRASWGLLGNQEINEFYPHASTWNTEQNYILPDGTVVGGSSINDLKNDDLKWESTEMYNFGTDITMYNKLNITADYFVKYTRDLLLVLPLPPSMGYDNNPYQNAGTVLNRGWELAADFSDNIGEFNYNVGFNVTHIHNEWLDLQGTETITNTTIQREGEAIGSFYGYEVEGIFQSGEEVANHAYQSGGTSAGDLKMKDQLTVDTNGDGIADAGDGVINEDDRVVIGNRIPAFSFGFNGGFQYKAWDFSFLFQGVYDVDRYTGGSGNHSGRSDRMSWVSDWTDYWTPDNPNASHPRLGGEALNDATSSFYIEDASYLRLKNVELGYTLPIKWANKLHLEKLRVYVSGQNLLTFTDLDHWDPESPSNLAYPLSKTFTVGVNIIF